MKVVAISLDPKVLDSKSAPSYRNRLYGEIVDEYRVIVHDRKDSILELTDTVTIYGVGGASKIIRLIRIGFFLRRLVKEGKCDVITSSDPYFFSLVAYLVSKKYHLGFEVHILGIEKLNPIRKAVASFFVRRASSVRVNSTRLRDRVSVEFSVPWKDISFVPIYVPTEELGFKKAPLGSVGRKEQEKEEAQFTNLYGQFFNFLFVGRLVEVKNVPMQLRAMKVLAGICPHARLHIVGSGPQESVLKAQTKSLGLEKQVIFHGRKEGYELGTLYRLCDSFILTSFSEGWPMVIFEAMTAPLPIIMTDVGCAGEMIQNNESGLVVAVDDSDALAEAMKRMCSEAGLKERIQEMASEHIRNYWTRDQILSGYKESWKKALANKL
jgi:glycosyltransferase involved in cell wall biosynthesis